MAKREDGNQHMVKPLVAVVSVHVVVTAFTWRDLRNRAPGQVRGSKRVWRIVSGANTLGSLLYLALGRKRAAS